MVLTANVIRGLTGGIDANAITFGTLSNARLPSVISGNGNGLMSLSASNISSGILSNERLPTTIQANFVGNAQGVSGLNIANVSIGILPVVRGGTGAANSTGTGNVVLSDNPVFNGNITLTSGAFIGNCIKSTTTLGTAQAFLDVSGLDITGDGGSYKIVIDVQNPNATNPAYYLWLNGDSTNTNYATTRVVGTSVSTASSTAQLPYLFFGGQGCHHFFELKLRKTTSGRYAGYGQGGFEAGVANLAALYNMSVVYLWTGTSNVTSLRLFTSDGSLMPIGTTVTVYRGGF